MGDTPPSAPCDSANMFACTKLRSVATGTGAQLPAAPWALGRGEGFCPSTQMSRADADEAVTRGGGMCSFLIGGIRFDPLLRLAKLTRAVVRSSPLPRAPMLNRMLDMLAWTRRASRDKMR